MSTTLMVDLSGLRDRAHEVVKSNPSEPILLNALELVALISRTEAMPAQSLGKIRVRLGDRVTELESGAKVTAEDME